MYDQSIIKSEFMGLVGLRQNDNPTFPQIPSTLLYTGSNVLVHHPLINIENIDLCARNYSKFNYDAYSTTEEYEIGDRVKVSGVIYQSLQNINEDHPVTDTDWWEVVNLLALFLEDIFTVANEDVLNQMFLKKKLNNQVKTLLKNTRLYSSPGSISDLVINEGMLVGLEIKLKYRQNIAALINRIGLQLSAPQDLTMYLYHSSQLDAIATITIHHTKTSSFQWHDSTLQMHFMNPDYESGGLFYLMYDQNDLVGQAVQKRYNFTISPTVCGYCEKTDLVNFGLYSQFISLRAVTVLAADRNPDDDINLWDIRKNRYVFDNNFGLNLEVTVRCDLTQFLVQQKTQFQYAIRDMVKVKILEVMATSTRDNKGQADLSVMARAELTSAYAGGMGIRKELENQLNGVDFEISELDNTCMPCNQKGGLAYGTIY